jgi:hypothetical protein
MIQTVGKQKGSRPDARRGRSGFAASMATANNDHIKGIVHSAPVKFTDLAKPIIACTCAAPYVRAIKRSNAIARLLGAPYRNRVAE